MMGQVIDYQEKLKKRGFEERDAWIRNHDKGYVFARDGITVPEVVRQLAVKAVGTLGLDFGAVDIGYREKEQLGYVFEVNTAPGLEGHTIESYVNGFKKELGI
jgi:glutathione synthase/RimK-type ligase-like ATP-grasp enzyme